MTSAQKILALGPKYNVMLHNDPSAHKLYSNEAEYLNSIYPKYTFSFQSKSYSIFDNSVNASTPQLTKNWLGWGGAFFADICCQFFGVFSYAIPFVLALAALRAVMSYFKRPLF